MLATSALSCAARVGSPSLIIGCAELVLATPTEPYLPRLLLLLTLAWRLRQCRQVGQQSPAAEQCASHQHMPASRHTNTQTHRHSRTEESVCDDGRQAGCVSACTGSVALTANVGVAICCGCGAISGVQNCSRTVHTLQFQAAQAYLACTLLSGCLMAPRPHHTLTYVPCWLLACRCRHTHHETHLQGP